MDCPACGKSMIEESFGDVQVDVCKSGCKGIWFDSGELREIRENYMSQEERDAYVQKLVADTPLGADAEKANIRAEACQIFGGLLSRRWPFVWP